MIRRPPRSTLDRSAAASDVYKRQGPYLAQAAEFLGNADPRRGIGHEKVLTQLELDEQAIGLLDKLGYRADTVPAPGEDVYLRLTANLSTGGTAVDMTDVVHPDNAEMAVRAIQAIGLDVGGVDFLTPDMTQSYKEIGGAICEVNAAPGFRMHMAPSEGRPRDVAGKVIDMLFPRNAPSTSSRSPSVNSAGSGTSGAEPSVVAKSNPTCPACADLSQPATERAAGASRTTRAPPHARVTWTSRPGKGGAGSGLVWARERGGQVRSCGGQTALRVRGRRRSSGGVGW